MLDWPASHLILLGVAFARKTSCRLEISKGIFALWSYLSTFGAGKCCENSPTLRSTYPTRRESGELPLHLSTHKEALQLFCGNPSRPRSTERVEDQIPLPRRGQKGAPEEAQGLLGGVAAVELLPHGHGGDAPDGGDLGGGIGGVYEVVVEGVAGAFVFGGPDQGFMGMGPRKLEQRRA